MSGARSNVRDAARRGTIAKRRTARAGAPLAGVGFGLRGRRTAALETAAPAPNSLTAGACPRLSAKGANRYVSVHVEDPRRLVRRFRAAAGPHRRAARRPRRRPRASARSAAPAPSRRSTSAPRPRRSRSTPSRPASTRSRSRSRSRRDCSRSPANGRRRTQRAAASKSPSADRNVYASERFTGRFRRVVALPEDADPDASRGQLSQRRAEDRRAEARIVEAAPDPGLERQLTRCCPTSSNHCKERSHTMQPQRTTPRCRRSSRQQRAERRHPDRAGAAAAGRHLRGRRRHHAARRPARSRPRGPCDRRRRPQPDDRGAAQARRGELARPGLRRGARQPLPAQLRAEQRPRHRRRSTPACATAC